MWSSTVKSLNVPTCLPSHIFSLRPNFGAKKSSHRKNLLHFYFYPGHGQVLPAYLQLRVRSITPISVYLLLI